MMNYDEPLRMPLRNLPAALAAHGQLPQDIIGFAQAATAHEREKKRQVAAHGRHNVWSCPRLRRMSRR